MTIDTTTARSRRAVLLATLGGLGAVVAQAVRPLGVAAADSGAINIGQSYSDVESTTSLTNTTNNHTILSAQMEPATDTSQTHGGVAIMGISNAAEGAGVYGHSSRFYGVRGTSTDGFGVRAESGSNSGLQALSGSGTGLISDGPQGGVYGSSHADGPGIHGFSTGGRGGVFEGRPAQVRLVPSASQNGHPHSGKSGDLFVDKGNRLWFCKGGTSWKQLA